MTMKYLSLTVLLSLVAVAYCARSPAGNVTENVQSGRKPLGRVRTTTTLTDLGGIALKMVEALTSDSDSREVDLEGLTNLVTSMSRSSVFVDNPQAMRDYDLSNRLTELEGKMEAELSKLRRQNEELQNALGQNNETKFIGFSASLSSSQSVVSGSAVKYDQVTINKGLQYDPAFGYLTCPLKGYYYVTLTYRTTTGTTGQFGLRLKVGSRAAGIQLSDYKNSGYHSKSISGSGVVYCGMGERMYAEATTSGSLLGGGSYTTISLYFMKSGEP